MVVQERRRLDTVIGDETGMQVPAHESAFKSAGVEFLTEAFRNFGSISADNRVTCIRRIESCPGGSTGKKLFLTVDYLRPEPGLHRELFVKFSRDFDDPVRDDRGRYEMEGEARFASLSRLHGFPIVVPRVYFSDHQQATNTGLIITERVPFGMGRIEPHKEKCLDHEIEDPFPYYRTIMQSLARISAMSRSRQYRGMFESRFPHDPVAMAVQISIPGELDDLQAKIDAFGHFFTQYRHLFPQGMDGSLFERIKHAAPSFMAGQRRLANFLQSDPSMIAFCHWNANIDNAWFWRDDDGQLQCGLMDWGHAGRMNIAYSLWGCLSGAHFDIWRNGIDELVDVFVTTFNEHDMVGLDGENVRRHFRIYAALMGLSYFMDAPGRISARFPDFANAVDRYDPVFRAHPTARNQLHISTVFLEMWRGSDIESDVAHVLSS